MNLTPDIELRVVDANVPLPKFQTTGAAAIDLCAYLPTGPVRLKPQHMLMVRTGLHVWLKDPHYALLIIPRSGKGTEGLVLAHNTGLIDSDYQGEIMVPLLNRLEHSLTGYDENAFFIAPGDRIAQAFVIPVVRPKFKVVSDFTGRSERGAGGFGSTGK